MIDRQTLVLVALILWLLLCVLAALRQHGEPPVEPPDGGLFTEVYWVVLTPREWSAFPMVWRGTGHNYSSTARIHWLFFGVVWMWSIPTQEQRAAYSEPEA